MSSVLDKVSKEAAVNYGKLSNDKETAMDPATILVFAQLIMELITKIKECRANKDAAAQTIKSPGLFQRMRLRSHVRESMTPSEFRSHGSEIIESLLQTGRNVQPSDVEELYNQA